MSLLSVLLFDSRLICTESADKLRGFYYRLILDSDMLQLPSVYQSVN